MRDELDAARKRLEALATAHVRAIDATAAAHQKLDGAVKERDAIKSRLAAAREAYSDAPSDAGAEAIRRLTGDLELAELRTTKPRRAAQDTDQAAEVAARALEECRLECVAIERARELARLRAVASPEAFAERTSEAFERAFILVDELSALQASILAELEVSRRAAVDCGAEALGYHHALLKVIAHVAAELPGSLEFLSHPDGVVATSRSAELGSLSIDLLLRSLRSRAHDATRLDVVLPTVPERVAMLRERLRVLGEHSSTPDAVRAAMAVIAAPPVEAPPPGLLARVFGAGVSVQ